MTQGSLLLEVPVPTLSSARGCSLASQVPDQLPTLWTEVIFPGGSEDTLEHPVLLAHKYVIRHAWGQMLIKTCPVPASLCLQNS